MMKFAPAKEQYQQFLNQFAGQFLGRGRVHVVRWRAQPDFGNPGTYLVICGVRPHFVAGMYGYVRVLP